MRDTRSKTDTTLKHADIRRRFWENKTWNAWKESMQPGRYVAWYHGEQKRLGKVIRVLGFDARSAGVVVESISTPGREQRISMSRVLALL